MRKFLSTIQKVKLNTQFEMRFVNLSHRGVSCSSLERWSPRGERIKRCILSKQQEINVMNKVMVWATKPSIRERTPLYLSCRSIICIINDVLLPVVCESCKKVNDRKE